MARKIYDLKADFGLDHTKSTRMIGQDFATASAAAAVFPRMYQRMKSKGPMFLGRPLTDDEFLKLYWFDACWGEALWQGQGGGQPIETGFLSSQNHVIVPWGTYRHAIPTEFSYGEYEMQGPGYTDVTNDSVNTKLEVGHENWLGHPEQRHTLVAGTWAVNGSTSGYLEGTRFHSFRVNGRQDASPEIISAKFESNGLMLWKPGEVTDSDRIWAENYRTRGFAVHGPTPTSLGNLSAFQCVVAGVGILGSWGGTIGINVLSSDACGAMFDMIPFNGSEAGGTVNINLIKNESMIASAGRSWRGQIVGNLKGQFCVNIGAISAAVGNGRIPALFVVDDRLTNGTPQSSYLSAKVKGWGYQLLVHDLKRGHGYASFGDYASGGFEYDTASGNLVRLGANATPVQNLAPYRVMHRIGGSGPLDITGTAPAYREIIVGAPAFSSTVYLDDQPPASATWVVGAWSDWSACINGQQTRTRTVTSSIAGQTPSGTKPAESETQSCVVTPTSGTFNVNDVLVVWNSATPSTQALAQEYAQKWGIPSSNIVSVNVGTSEAATSSQINAARGVLEPLKKEVHVLCWEVPFIGPNGQTITSAISFGVRSVTNLTVSPLYGYSGYKPRTDKGAPISSLLMKSAYIRKDAHGTKPQGQAILLLAKDTNSQGNPRGSARAGQTAQGVVVWDNRNYAAVGSGLNNCNNISNLCWRNDRLPGITPIIAGYQSNYGLGDAGSAIWAKGFFGDHVTSYGGYVSPSVSAPSYINSKGQTSMVYHLEKGASMTVGTADEPWQDKSGNSPGSLVEQFVNVSKFHPLFLAGLPVGVATWSSVKCPDRSLFAGDPLCAPFA